MSPETIGIIGTLSGVIIGGLISAIISYSHQKHERCLETSKRQLAKLEESHKIITNIKISLGNTYTEYNIRLIAGNLVHEHLSEDLEEENDIKPIPYDSLKMIIGFYAPSLKKEVDNFIEHCSFVFGDVLAKAMIALSKQNNEEEKENISKQLRGEYSKIKVLAMELQDNIVKISKNYTE